MNLFHFNIILLYTLKAVLFYTDLQKPWLLTYTLQ